LVQYSKEANADLMVVSSHGRSGLGRLVMGSFAENVLAKSNIPVLFLSKSVLPNQGLSKILFPTDWSNASKRALDLFLNQMKGVNSEIILYHAVSPPGAVFDSGVLGVPYYLPESYYLEQRRWVEEQSSAFQKIVSDQGFQVRAVIRDGVLNTPSAIQAIAQEEKVSLVAMASASRGFESTVMGSVAKEIFRIRQWPVWVSGPEVIFEKEKSK